MLYISKEKMYDFLFVHFFWIVELYKVSFMLSVIVLGRIVENTDERG